MGRELKRVPLDFNWPMEMVWKGYVNPYRSVQCKACGGSGYSEKSMEYKYNWYGSEGNNWTLNPYRRGCRYRPDAHKYNLTQLEVDALVKEGRISELCKDGHHPTPEDVREFQLRNFMRLDKISMHICLCATAEAEGWDTDCPFCGGTGGIGSVKRFVSCMIIGREKILRWEKAFSYGAIQERDARCLLCLPVWKNLPSGV